MNANPNVELLQRSYARWSETKGANIDEVPDMFDDRIEMRSVLTDDVPHETSGTHRTQAEARAYFEALQRDWEMIFYEVDRFIADEDDVVMVGRCRYRHRGTNQEVETPKVDIWHFENGKATQFFELFDSLGFARAIGAV